MKLLLVIDIQTKYLPYYSSDLISRINSRIAAAGAENVPVFYVRNIGIKGDSDSYELAKELLVVSERIYTKKFPSAFTSDEFANALENMNVTDIEVVGVDGNSCVKKTCIDAINASYNVTLDLACTAARNTEIFEKTLAELSEHGVIFRNKS